MLTDARDKGHPADTYRLVVPQALRLKLREAVVSSTAVFLGGRIKACHTTPHVLGVPRVRGRTGFAHSDKNYPPLGRFCSISARVPEVTESR